MCYKRYVVNPAIVIDSGPAAACPSRIGKLVSPISPSKARKLAKANTPLIAEGPKTRTPDDIRNWTGFSALGGPKTDAKPAKAVQPSSDAALGALTPMLPPS